MFIKEVNIPEALMSAQQENNLVIFAGAGVSIPSPSNYPDFDNLAEIVAAGTLTREKDEPIDHFLGRLEKNGVNVHLRTKNFLTNPESKPNQLHAVLLNIFRSADNIRLVTTNFDNHFTTTVKNLFGDQLEIYYAPALPLGHNFSGIVYLHGGVDKNYNNLILTDGDFGKAYLTDGWATTFLKQLFQKYTVLFIGYSHSDLVMHYLSRGLPTNTTNRRFALIGEDNKDFWNFLNITPVTYPYRTDDKHAALRESLIGWMEISKMGVLDHKQKIQRITSSVPPVDLEEADYIEKDVLRDPVKTRFFIEHAKTIEWISWLEGKNEFMSIFRFTESLPENSRLLAYWFAENFVCEYTEDALALIQRKGQKISLDLWNAIGCKLHAVDKLPHQNDLSKIITLLIQTDHYKSDHSPLDYVLRKLRLPEDKIAAVLLFEYLSKPCLILKPRYHVGEEKERVYKEINIRGESHWLKKSWDEFIRSNLNAFALDMKLIITSHLRKAHYILRSLGNADRNFDHISFGRPAIEPHSQNEFSGKGVGVLIDPARDVIEWLLKNNNKKAVSVIDTWFESDTPILKRLALHGIAENQAMNANDKIAWILDRKLLFEINVKHELFRILSVSYPYASDSQRSKLIDNIIFINPEKKLDIEQQEYQKYNLLVWLNSIFPECALAKNKLREIQGKNPKFTPREHPDFSYWMGSVEWVGPRSPITVEELLQKNPETELEWLLSYEGDRFNGPDRDGLLSVLVEAISKSKDWSWKLILTLEKAREWNTDLWSGIFRGWTIVCKEGQAMLDEFEFIGMHPELLKFHNQISDLLQEYVRSGRQFPLVELTLAENIANNIAKYSNEKPKLDELESEDWLTRAINHSGGKIAQFWMHALSLINKEAGNKEIPSRYKQSLESILSGMSAFDMYGRIVLASQLHFLFYLDSEWTCRLLLPLFNWEDDLKTEQVWHGFAFWGRVNEELLKDIRPFFENSFIFLNSKLEKIRDRFCEHLAYMAVYGSENPVQQGWLLNFIKTVELKDRVSLAHYIRQALSALNNKGKQNLWEKWIENYWKMRVSGVPVQLHPDEVKEMIEWTLELEPVFEGVVDLFYESPAPKIEHTNIFHNLLEGNFPSQYPKASAKLLVYVLPNIKYPWYNRDINKIFSFLEKKEIDQLLLRKIKDEMARLGC